MLKSVHRFIPVIVSVLLIYLNTFAIVHALEHICEKDSPHRQSHHHKGDEDHCFFCQNFLKTRSVIQLDAQAFVQYAQTVLYVGYDVTAQYTSFLGQTPVVPRAPPFV